MGLEDLIAYIREQGPAVLASSEDAEYFRKAYRKSAPIPTVKESIELPKMRPLPQAIKVEKPPVLAAPPQERSAVLTKPILPYSQVRNVFSVIAPDLKILEEIPGDEIAKKISMRWKTKNRSAPISILVYQEPPEQRTLLNEIANAIDICFGPAKIVQAEEIEKEKQWGTFLSVEDLKTVLLCDYTLWQLKELMHFYKETPAQGIRLLGEVPLFLLPDLSLYLKDGLLKRSLWRALCQKFS